MKKFSLAALIAAGALATPAIAALGVNDGRPISRCTASRAASRSLSASTRR